MDENDRKKINDLKRKLVDLYSKPPGYYLSELADRFDIEPRFVMKAICELKNEGIFTEENSKFKLEPKG